MADVITMTQDTATVMSDTIASESSTDVDLPASAISTPADTERNRATSAIANAAAPMHANQETSG